MPVDLSKKVKQLETELDQTKLKIRKIIDYLGDIRIPEFEDYFATEIEEFAKEELKKEEDLYRRVLKSVKEREIISVFTIMREFSIGYAKATRIFTKLEENNIIEKSEDLGKPSKVKV